MGVFALVFALRVMGMFYSVESSLDFFKIDGLGTVFSAPLSVMYDVLIQYCTTTCSVSCIDNDGHLLWELLI
jgi:hypothetical protein